MGSYQSSPTNLIKTLMGELCDTKEALAEANQALEAMKSSKFWLLRSQWLKFKKMLG